MPREEKSREGQGFELALLLGLAGGAAIVDLSDKMVSTKGNDSRRFCVFLGRHG